MDRQTILTLSILVAFLFIPLTAFSSDSNSQQNEKKKCPTVEVKGPRRSKGWKEIIYRARIKNLPTGSRKIFNWSIEGAEILTGQGTDLIRVQPYSAFVGATVMVENLPNGCQPTQASMDTELTDIVIACRLPPFINVVLSSSSIVRPCPEGRRSENCATTGNFVEVKADAPDEAQDEFLFTWSVTGGRLIGEGRRVTWDLSGVPKGTYRVDG